MAAPTRLIVLYTKLTPSSITVTDEDPNFPATNLYDEDVSTVCRTTNGGVKYYEVNLGSAQNFDTFAIAGHNIPASASVGIIRSASSGSTPGGAGSFRANHWIYNWDTVASYQYVRFSIIYSTTYHEIGEMWVGTRVELAFNPQIPIGIIDEKVNLVKETAGGQRWVYDKYFRRGYKMHFIEDITPSAYSVLKALYDDRKKSKPFFFRLYPADTNFFDLFVHTEEWGFSVDGKDKRPGDWTVIEEK